MSAPTADDLASMLRDALNGVPFSGPGEWRPVWDSIVADLKNVPSGVVVDVPYEIPDVPTASLSSRFATAKAVFGDAAISSRRDTALRALGLSFGGPGSGPREGEPHPHAGRGDGSKNAPDEPKGQAAVAESHMFDALREADGGFTINPGTGEQPTTGYAVAVRGASSITPADRFFSGPPGKELGRQVLRDYVREHKDLLSKPGMHIGGWHDPKNKEIVLDPSQVVADKTEAVKLGREGNQQAIADLGAIHAGDWDNAFVDTGGTGDR